MVGQIVPWNFPFMFTSWKLGPALAAGNTAVMKPSELVPLSTLRLCELMVEVGFRRGRQRGARLRPRGGARIAAHPDIAKVSFTGSTRTGRSIVEASAGNLKRLHLELGGKGANVVFADADLDAAVNGSAFAIFHNQGQACIAGSRLVLRGHRGRVPRPVPRLARSLRIGDPLAPGTEMGPPALPEHRDRVLSYVKVAEDEGGEVLYGGTTPDDPALASGCYVLLTVVRADPGAGVPRGGVRPFVTVTTFADDEEAVAIGQQHRLRPRRRAVDPRPVPLPPWPVSPSGPGWWVNWLQAGRPGLALRGRPVRLRPRDGLRGHAGLHRAQVGVGQRRRRRSRPGTRGVTGGHHHHAPDAVATHVHDGDVVALEGFTHLIPYAAGHEIIRQGRRDLTLVRMTPDIVYDQLIGKGCARKLVFSWGGNPGVGLAAPLPGRARARLAPAAGAGGAQPRRHGQPLRPGRRGSLPRGAARLRRHRPARLHRQRGHHRLPVHRRAAHRGGRAAVRRDRHPRPGLRPRRHVQLGITGVQKEAVLAARRLIVTVEEIVDDLDDRPGAVVLPSWVVTAVAEVPGGRRPATRTATRCDNAAHAAWDGISRDRATFRQDRPADRLRAEHGVTRGTPMAIATQTMTHEQRKSVAIEYLKAFDRGGVTSDGSSILDLFADDAQVYFPKWGVASGKEQIGKLFGDVGGTLGSIEHHYSEFNWVFSGSDVIAARAPATASTARWPWRAGVPDWAAGRWCDVFEIRDFLIQRVFIYLDPDYAARTPPATCTARRRGRHVSVAAYTADEMMTVAAARHLADGEVCFVGIGIPSLAANLARHMHALGLVLVYESGTIGSKPRTIPLPIGDSELAETADAAVSVPEIFNYWLQPGRIDVGFLGAAELDRRGDINTTVIGPYDVPRVRLPGQAGRPRSPGRAGGSWSSCATAPGRWSSGSGSGTLAGDRVATVVTDIGVLEREYPDRDELVLAGFHLGRTVDEARAATGWDLAVDGDVAMTEPPTGEELDALRELAPATDRVA